MPVGVGEAPPVGLGGHLSSRAFRLVGVPMTLSAGRRVMSGRPVLGEVPWPWERRRRRDDVADVKVACSGWARRARTACRARRCPGPGDGPARELRRMGIEVRVHRPLRRPTARPFVTPLGNSLPTSANGSIAAARTRPFPAMLRTTRVLTEEQFDVLHLHNRSPRLHRMTRDDMPPGADHWHLSLRRSRLELQAPARLVPPNYRRPTTARGVEETPPNLDSRTSAVTTRSCSTASNSTTTRQRSALSHRRADHLLLRPPRGTQGPRRPARRDEPAARPTSVLWVAADRTRHGAAATESTPDDRRDPVARRGHRGRQDRPAHAERRCSRAVASTASRSGWCWSRPWRQTRDRGERSSTATANVATTRDRRGMLAEPGDVDGLAGAHAGCSTTSWPRGSPRAWRAIAASTSSRWIASPRSTPPLRTHRRRPRRAPSHDRRGGEGAGRGTPA